jgi:hypothetical protein
MTPQETEAARAAIRAEGEAERLDHLKKARASEIPAGETNRELRMMNHLICVSLDLMTLVLQERPEIVRGVPQFRDLLPLSAGSGLVCVIDGVIVQLSAITDAIRGHPPEGC